MTTKEQERKALKQIIKIVASLGEDSYIATAFEGCFEIADTNIENDFACSMKQRWEEAEKKAATLEKENAGLRESIQQSKEYAETLENQVREFKRCALSADDLLDLEQTLTNAIYECDTDMRQAAETIVRMAHHPTDISFQKSVRIHRAAQKKRQHLDELKARVLKAKETIE